MVEGTLLIVTIIFGTLLIRGVLHEINQRERIERLANDLRAAYARLKDLNDTLELKVAAQTEEIRAAYDVEKKARLELEQLNKTKDQFITSTQHHLRTPLTALKWDLETINDGSCGPISPELKKVLQNTNSSVKRLGNIIEDFIKITEKEGSGGDNSTLTK